MTIEIFPTEQEDQKIELNDQGGASEAVYGLGLIGAWVYYFGRATTTGERVKGFFKGLFGRRSWCTSCSYSCIRRDPPHHIRLLW